MTAKFSLRLNESAYSPDALLPVAARIGDRVKVIETVRSRPSLLFRCALESIDAAITLLALHQVSQAYLLLFQAAEVSLKGLLDEIQQSGVSAWAAQNPKLFRNRANSKQGFDSSTFRETIKEKTFVAAFREVSAFVDFSSRVNDGHRTVNNTRSEIIHRGGEADRTSHYLKEFLTILLPMLDEFYSKALDLDLSDFVLHDVARELLVASRYMRLHGDESDSWLTAISTARFAYFHKQLNEHGAPSDFDPYGSGWSEDIERDFKWEEYCARKLGANVLSDEYTSCRICGERCYLATEGELEEHNGKRFFSISELICPYCHLSIADPRLALHHYGVIDRDTLGGEAWIKLLKNFGYEKEAELEVNE